MADRLGLESLDREGTTVVLKFRQDAKLDPAMILRLIQSRGDLTLLPPAVIRMDLSKTPGVVPSKGTARNRHPESVQRQKSVGTDTRSRAIVLVDRPRDLRSRARLHEAGDSGRKTADPSAPGGLFERVGQLLEQLSQSLVAS